MSDQREYQDEPNQEGYGGAVSTPEPQPEREPQEVDGEAIAVPSSDLTRPIAEAMEGMSGDHDDD
jgi:hypothetical protein